jgi:hypothetical protein
VQGDKSKQGELFGLKNIFALDEFGTTTKHTVRLKLSDIDKCSMYGQIERSHLAQLDWALTNLEGKASGKGKGAEKVDVRPTDTWLFTIDTSYDLKPEMNGLTSLFFGTGKHCSTYLLP